MPEFVIHKVAEALNARRKSVNGSKVLILGIAYKANVDDDRESPSYVLMDLLKKRGAEVSYYDPHIPVIRPSREHSHWAGTRSVEWKPEVLRVRSGPHFDSARGCGPGAGRMRQCIVDTRNAMAGIRRHGQG